MKKIVSIFLIALLLFNALGYYGLFMGITYQNKQSLIHRFDGNTYNEAEAVTIKIPVSIPYVADSKDYERVDGEFEHEGEFYHLVKQRLSEDTLYVVCIKDNTSKRIHKALEDYVKTFTDKPVDTGSTAKIMTTFMKEYVSGSFEIKEFASGWSQSVAQPARTVVFIDSFSASIIHPPERA